MKRFRFLVLFFLVVVTVTLAFFIRKPTSSSSTDKFLLDGISLGMIHSEVQKRLGQEEEFEIGFQVAHFENAEVGFDSSMKVNSVRGTVLYLPQQAIIRIGENYRELNPLSKFCPPLIDEDKVRYQMEDCEVVLYLDRGRITAILLHYRRNTKIAPNPIREYAMSLLRYIFKAW